MPIQTVPDTVIESIYSRWKNKTPVTELAKEYGLHRDTIYRYIRMGKQRDSVGLQVAVQQPTATDWPKTKAEWSTFLRMQSNPELSDICDYIDAEVNRRNNERA